MSGYEWVQVRHFAIPHNAVRCGTDLDGSEIFVGQSFYDGDQLPCKVIPRRKEAYICYNGKEIRVDNFKVLCPKSMCWIPSRDGQVPPGAVPAGRTRSGETLYVGRTTIHNAVVVGKVHPSHRTLYVPFDGKEVAHKHYEVLVFH